MRPLRLVLPALALVTLFVPTSLVLAGGLMLPGRRLASAITPAQQSGSSIATSRIFEAIGLSEGMTVCEIGAGDGALTVEAARTAGPNGRVYTSELGEERIRTLQANVAKSGLSNITVVAGDPAKTNLPDAACDALFMRNVYHHFADPLAMNASIAAALKPGSRLAVIDFTPPNKEAASPSDRDQDGTHGVTPDTVAREMKEAGLEQVASEAGAQRWFMVVAQKRMLQLPAPSLLAASSSQHGSGF
jgi:precorrin-6B methylase 2